MPSPTRILVTGGAGFIGSHLVDALMRRRIFVAVVDDLSSGRRENVHPNAKFLPISILHPDFSKWVARFKPDAIFHLAAQVNVRQSVEDPLKDAYVNILGTIGLLQAAAKTGVKKIIFSSSGGALYAGSKLPYSEKSESAPVSPYGIAKRSAEGYLDFARSIHGLSAVSLRYANVYGPRQRSDAEGGAIAIFTRRLLHSQPVVINGTGGQTRDFVYVEDVVKANLLAWRRPVYGAFNIGTGKETDLNTVFRLLKKITGSDVLERHGPAAPGEVLRSVLDIRKARKELGWKPEGRLEEGLRRTVEWFRNQTGRQA